MGDVLVGVGVVLTGSDTFRVRQVRERLTKEEQV